MLHEKADTQFWIELLNPIHWQLFATISYPSRIDNPRIIDKDVLLLKRFIAKQFKTIVVNFWAAKHQHELTHIHILFAARDYIPFYSSDFYRCLSSSLSSLKKGAFNEDYRRLAHILRRYPFDIQQIKDPERVIHYLSDRNTSRLYSSSGSFSSFALSFEDFNHSDLKQLRRYGAREPYDFRAELQKETGEKVWKYRKLKQAQTVNF